MILIRQLYSLLVCLKQRLLGSQQTVSVYCDPWAIFHRGRALDARRDAKGAFHCHLEAAKAGLPVASVLTWMAYRLGHGVTADPVAATAWAQRAKSSGWPDVLEREPE